MLDDLLIPIVQEEARVIKRAVRAERVRVSTSSLRRTRVEVERTEPDFQENQ